MALPHLGVNCPFGSNCSMPFAHHATPAPSTSRAIVAQGATVAQGLNLTQPATSRHTAAVSPMSVFESRLNIPALTRSITRAWEHIVEPSESFRFKVLSYNVLAQVLLESNKLAYMNCKRENLSWETRSERIFNEVINLDADILCFQEVQESHKEFYERFEEKGYVGVFKKKTGGKGDGCATYFRKSVFEMDVKVGVEYHHPSVGFLTPDNVGLIVKLTPKEVPSKSLIIANTHLACHRFREPTRIAQIRVLLNEIERLSLTQDTDKDHMPVILAGDLNSTPDSFVIKLLNEGKILVPLTESLWQIGLPEYETGASNVPEFMQKIVEHPFKFSSVYKNDELSLFKIGASVVDYIFYTKDSLKPVERLAHPSRNARRSIPNEIFGSDHVCIAGTLELID